MKLKRQLATAVAIAALSCHSPIASAAVYSFSGLIDTNHSDHANLTSFTGIFSFDPSRPDLAPADANNGYYPMTSSLYGLSVQFLGGTSFQTNPLAGYSFSVHVPAATIPGGTPDHGHFDISGSVLGETNRFLTLNFIKDFVMDALPTGVNGFDLNDFDEALFSYHGLPDIAPLPGQIPVPPFGAYGHLTALACIEGCAVTAAVPEPGTMALLFAGLAMPGLLFRRRRVVAADASKAAEREASAVSRAVIGETRPGAQAS